MLSAARWTRFRPGFWAVTWKPRRYVFAQVDVKTRGEPGRQPRFYWWVALRNGPIGFFRIASTAELR